MALWIFQALVNILLFGVALMWMLSRKRARFLEAQLDRVEREVESLKGVLRRDGSSLSYSPDTSTNATTNTLTKTSPTSNLALGSASSGSSKASALNSSANSSGNSSAKTSGNTNSPLNHSFSSAAFVAANPLAPKVPGAQGTLVEKRVDQPTRKTLSKAETAEAYDKASLLMARGVAIREIARLTGLSLAELQLMGKVSQRNQ